LDFVGVWGGAIMRCGVEGWGGGNGLGGTKVSREEWGGGRGVRQREMVGGRGEGERFRGVVRLGSRRASVKGWGGGGDKEGRGTGIGMVR